MGLPLISNGKIEKKGDIFGLGERKMVGTRGRQDVAGVVMEERVD